MLAEAASVDWGLPGVWLHPNCHEYDLKDPLFVEVLQSAAAHGLIVYCLCPDHSAGRAERAHFYKGLFLSGALFRSPVTIETTPGMSCSQTHWPLSNTIYCTCL